MSFNPFSRWQGKLLAFILLAFGYFGLGSYLALNRHYLPYDALARLVSAYLVFYGKEVKLATIGFVWPPIPTLLILPFAAVKALVHSWLAVVIVSSLAMSAACIAIDRIAELCGLSRFWRFITFILFATNPLIVVFAINGMSEAILIAATLGGCYWLLRFWSSDRNMHLLVASGFFSLLPLIRYEAAVLTAGAALVILLQTWIKGRNRFQGEAYRNYVEGRLLGYSGLAVYPLFLWAVTSWFIMGNPIYFLANDRSALSLAEGQLGGYGSLVTGIVTGLGTVLLAWVGTFPIMLIATIAALVIAVRKKSYFMVGLVIFAWIIPLTQYLLLTRSATVPLLRYFILTVPLGVVLMLAVWRSITMLQLNGFLKRRNLILAVGALLFLVSNLSTLAMLKGYQYQNIEGYTWQALTTKKDIPNRDVNDAMAVGKALAEIVPEGSRVLVDTYQFGFAVVLGADNPKMFFDFTDSDYDEAIQKPREYVDYILVPQTEGRGAFYLVNRAHPRLHDQGATWADLVDKLPPSGLQWRLYKVKR